MSETRYTGLVDDALARDPDFATAKMMGMPCVKKGGRMVAGFWRGAMVFKLPEAELRERALAIPGAHLFDPSERDRPMKEWVVVPADQADEWPDLFDCACQR